MINKKETNTKTMGDIEPDTEIPKRRYIVINMSSGTTLIYSNKNSLTTGANPRMNAKPEFKLKFNLNRLSSKVILSISFIWHKIILC